MATLTVWKFPNLGGAEGALHTVKQLQQEQSIQLADAAIVSWAPGKKHPKTRQLNHLGAVGALNGTFWGLLFGLLFFVPVLGLAIGAALGGLAGSLTDVGIDDDFIKDVRSEVTEGTSALFLLTTGAVMDKVEQAFAGQDMTLIRTNLSSEQETQLREAFAAAD